jgi:hypothetical protein
MDEILFIPNTPAPRSRRGIRVTTLMVAVLVAGGLFGLVHAVDRSREAARVCQCGDNLKQIGLAFLNYHEAYGSFPPAYVADAAGKPIHSWRVLILPFLEQSMLYNSYSMAEPWDGPSNRKLLAQRPGIFGCPSRDGGGHLTSCVVIVGPKTLFPGSKSRTLGDIRDGASQTFLLVEVSNVNIPWTEPRDLDAETMSWVFDDPSRPSISSPHERGPNVAFADDSIRVLGLFRPSATLKALATIDGGEMIDLEK